MLADDEILVPHMQFIESPPGLGSPQSNALQASSCDIDNSSLVEAFDRCSHPSDGLLLVISSV
tara:strand:- start:1390 stop:1578 length:189 start_codon:yes stop_codon:yes gene_type:complete